MKSSHLLILFLFSFASCEGDTIPDMKIQFIANWAVGDETQYKVTKTKEDTKFGFSQGKFEMTQIGALNVLNKTNKGYDLEWKIVKTIYPEGIEMDTLYTRMYEEMMKSFKIRYTTDLSGRFIELVNWEDILNFQFETMDKIPDMIEAKEGVKYKEIKRMLSQMLNSKEQVEDVFIQEIKLLHTYYGSSNETKKINPKNKSIPNIFGGQEILINTLLTVEQVDTIAKWFSGYESFKLDEETKNKVLSSYIVSLEEKFGKSKQTVNSAKDLYLDIADETKFNLDYNAGLVNSISYERNATIKSDSQDLIRKKKVIIERIK